MTLILSFPDTAVYELFKTNLSKLHEIEKMLHLVRTKEVVKLTEINGILYTVVQASKFWIKTVYNVSLYTFLLKCCGYKLQDLPMFEAISKVKQPKKMYDGKMIASETVETGYAKSVLAKSDFIFKHIKKFTKLCKTPTGYMDKVNINTIHNNSGFVSLSNPTDWLADNVIAQYFKANYK